MAMHWRLGYHRVFTTWPRTPHAFGHFGYGGSGAWADPSRHLAVGYIVNTGSGSPFADLRLWRINTAIINAVEELG
jgi:CubicO group peptidase (beta-lactamase class C family)